MYIHAMEYFKNDLSLPCSGFKVKTKLQTKFGLRPFMNPILSKQKFCLNFMKKFLTFKTFILDFRQILDLKPFVNPTPGLVFTKGIKLKLSQKSP